MVPSVAPRPGLRTLQENFLTAFSFPWAVKNQVKRSGRIAPQATSIIDDAITNMSEDYHTAIEHNFRPYLKSMLEGDASFYCDEEKAAEFLYGLSVQYLRTKQSRESIIAAAPRPFKSIERVWNVLTHMYAVTMGASLFGNRDHFKIVLVDNDTSVPFITGDQPIINFRANPKDNTNPPETMELYYPLSPTKATLFVEKSNQIYAAQSSLTIEEAHSFNLLIAAHSFQQLFSNSEEYLKFIKSSREKSVSA